MHYMCMALLYLCQEGHAHQLGQVGAGHAQPAVPHLAGAGHAHLVDEVSQYRFNNLYSYVFGFLGFTGRDVGARRAPGCQLEGLGRPIGVSKRGENVTDL